MDVIFDNGGASGTPSLQVTTTPPEPPSLPWGKKLVSTQTFTSSGTWYRPTNCTYVIARCWGAGQSGSVYHTLASGYGGSGGGFIEFYFAASALPSSVPVTVGLGGVGLSKGQQNAGGNTAFGSYITAYGGGDPGYPGSYFPKSGMTKTISVAGLVVGPPTQELTFTEVAAVGSVTVNTLGTVGDGGYGGSNGNSANSSTYGGGGGGYPFIISGTLYNRGGTSTYGGAGGAGAASVDETGQPGNAPGGGGGFSYATSQTFNASTGQYDYKNAAGQLMYGGNGADGLCIVYSF